ncbi:hypothetical protein ACIBBG_31760 [Micromonospora chersina]|uniref:hypothetical protein n=1 Tax=Micromonospora chersina TaxID=47854 RepID=UPI003793D5F0
MPYRRSGGGAVARGPGDGQVVSGGGETVVWQACLYEITPEFARRSGRDLRVYRHRPDCCEPYGRGGGRRPGHMMVGGAFACQA